MELRALLGKECVTPHTIPPGLPVEDAIRFMSEMKTPALIVVEQGEPVGVLTEADILQSCVQCGGPPFSGLEVADVMTRGPIVAEAKDEVGAGLAAMLESGIGCLPVVEDGRVVGILFLRDLVRHRIEELTAEIDMLHEYVASLQDAIRD
jgi:CBS domain-containing protein